MIKTNTAPPQLSGEDVNYTYGDSPFCSKVVLVKVSASEVTQDKRSNCRGFEFWYLKK